MTGLSDLAQNIGADNKQSVTKALKPKAVLTSALTGGVSSVYDGYQIGKRLDPTHLKNDHATLTGATQKKEQLQRATDANTAAKAASDAEIAADAAAAEKKRIAGIMPVADDAAAKAEKRRRQAAASAGGREGTILSGQRLGD